MSDIPVVFFRVMVLTDCIFCMSAISFLCFRLLGVQGLDFFVCLAFLLYVFWLDECSRTFSVYFVVHLCVFQVGECSKTDFCVFQD